MNKICFKSQIDFIDKLVTEPDSTAFFVGATNRPSVNPNRIDFGDLPKQVDLTFKMRKKEGQLPCIEYLKYVLLELKSFGLGYLELLAGLFHDLGEYQAIENNINLATENPVLRNFFRIGRLIPNIVYRNLNKADSSIGQCIKLISVSVGIPSDDVFRMEEKVTNRGHEEISYSYARDFMTKWGFRQGDIDTVCYLIKWHMKVYMLSQMSHEDEIREMIQHPDFWRLKYIWIAVYNSRDVKSPRISMSDINKMLNKNKHIKKFLPKH